MISTSLELKGLSGLPEGAAQTSEMDFCTKKDVKFKSWGKTEVFVPASQFQSLQAALNCKKSAFL